MSSAVVIAMNAVVISSHLLFVKIDAIAMAIVVRTIAATTNAILCISTDPL